MTTCAARRNAASAAEAFPCRASAAILSGALSHTRGELAAIARHQSTILPVADSSSGNTTPVPAQPLSAVDQQIVAPSSLKPNASARDAGAPTASFKRVWAGKDEVDYISDDVTIRHFRPLPTPKKSSAWNKQVNIGKDVTVRYFNSPPLPTAEPSGQQASEQAVKD